jgi:hypothetical protein
MGTADALAIAPFYSTIARYIKFYDFRRHRCCLRAPMT